ncbi:unnamed protein product [Urochloa humidicola]
MAAVATGTDGIAALPEELLLAVFSLVGSVKNLFLFAVTSRRWLRRFTDPAFLRELFPGHRARLLGFFFHSSAMKLRMAPQRTSVSAPTFLPAPGSSPLGPTERALAAFVSDDDGTFNNAEPLAARRGFVLIQLAPRIFDNLDQMRPAAAGELLAICNPATGERHVIPPLVSSWSCGVSVNGYAIITTADEGNPPPPSSPVGFITFSQLLLITTWLHGVPYLHSYSAATRSWAAEPTACMDDGSRFSLVGERPAAVHRGAAHWLCNDDKTELGARRVLYKLSAELGAARGRGVSLTKLPVRAGGTPLLYVTGDGELSIACVYLVHATVWTKRQDVCHRTRVFRLPMAVPNPTDPLELKYSMEEWFVLDRGSMLVMYRGGGVFILDVEKEVMQKVMDCLPQLFSGEQHRRYVPYEMDLWSCSCLVLAG